MKAWITLLYCAIRWGEWRFNTDYDYCEAWGKRIAGVGWTYYDGELVVFWVGRFAAEVYLPGFYLRGGG